jgi:acetate kinase
MARLTRALVVNAGSSSLKWSVLEAEGGATLSGGDEPWRTADTDERLAHVKNALAVAGAVDLVGHRVTHGGTRFRHAVRLDGEVRRALEELVPLDALHLRPALDAIDAVTAVHPTLPQLAAFDTAFHATMPPHASLYAIPRDWTERLGIRRFGFHGLSVDWSTSRAAEMLGGDPARLVVCHLGSGCSVTAVACGRSVDTTMGFSPFDGVVMATRAGSIDPGALLHLLIEEGLGAEEIRTTLAEKSGWLGVSGISTDLREVLAAADRGDERARLATDLFIQSLRRAIGSMAGVLGGADAVVFTGGVGEGSARIRYEAATALSGLRFDAAANDAVGTDDAVISAPESATRALVVHAREDLVVLREVRRVL